VLFIVFVLSKISIISYTLKSFLSLNAVIHSKTPNGEYVSVCFAWTRNPRRVYFYKWTLRDPLPGLLCLGPFGFSVVKLQALKSLLIRL
jgi:hypothetical protein